ncbi:aldehyde ferredoxin oxidoreductase family protein [Marispirochaeta aestuarii]|uniref:aldehyde ferredoxin oxidoreductase family protein n=1 Tax=Marispirochaeta aestuarii TaxID=1963862 RepID=UPI0029C8036B|nr:aldehyde ferredoxin oxidoreductase family protein [Marispirochaeta aestuarii]
MKGFFNRILRIDATDHSFTYEDISDDILKTTLGGKGLGTHLLTEENPPGVDPFSPENRLIICVGPITGTRIWSQSRYAVFSKSPATGGFCESYCGGELAPKIKGCGVDAIIIQGKSSSRVYLNIDEEGVEFHDAGEITGAECYDAERYILSRAGKGAGAMVIGPAGENLVAQAAIKSDLWRSAGRGGLGAVMGSKGIKGISFKGTKKADIADPEKLTELVKKIATTWKDSPVTKKYQTYGTPSQVAVTNGAGCFPTRYWQSGVSEHWQNLSADYMHEHFEVSRHGCPSCFLQCTKHAKVKSGRHAGLEVDGPEYETIYALGGLNCLDSLEEVAWLNDICDRLGLDTMSAGNLSALAVEAYKRGKTDFAIDYNQPDRMAEFFRLLANAEGVGAIFAKGIKTAAAELDLEDIAVHVKGLEPAGFDPRVLKGMGLSYATSPRGACHLRGTFYKAELTGEVDPEEISGKARYHIDYEDRAALFDSMILCRFFRDFYLWDELSEMIEATTGMKMDKEELELLANQITQKTRAFNRREGIGPEQDTLPKRLLKEATKEGAVLTEADLQIMIQEYNNIRKERDEKAHVIS